MELKLLWYCTKSNLKLYKTRDNDYTTLNAKANIFGYEELNGKIVAVSDYEVEEIRIITQYTTDKSWDVYLTPNLAPIELKEHSCLNDSMLNKYKPNYAIHIQNLYEFIKPKELKDLYIKGAYHNPEQMFTDEIQINGEWFHPMKKAPQNMCYAVDEKGNRYVIISVHPEWLCLILNGLKDVELRRKVLKEMKE